MSYGIICGSVDCRSYATHRYTWPGKDEAAICDSCASKLRGVASAIGLHLQLIPLTDEDHKNLWHALAVKTKEPLPSSPVDPATNTTNKDPMSDNLQQIVDGMRSDLKRGLGGLWQIEHPAIRTPLVLQVTPDGVSWLVRFTCGDRVLFETGMTTSVNADEFISALYVFLRAGIKAMTTPPPKAS